MESHGIGNTLRNAIPSLPAPDASLAELVSFCHAHNPTREFQERWGHDYRDKVRELWSASTHAFADRRPIGVGPDELLLCMAFDVAVAPYLGVPETTSVNYLHAVLRELREKLETIVEE